MQRGENRPTHVTGCGLGLHTCNDACPAAVATVFPLNFPLFLNIYFSLFCCCSSHTARSQSTCLSPCLIVRVFGGVQLNIVSFFFF